MSLNSPTIRIHVITYRRPNLLKRALKSILEQSYQNWIAEVINDDPNDNSVEDIINSINDRRIFLSKPLIKRGGTGNFNYAFRKIDEPFACILEDDNWYEENFIQNAILEFDKHPSCEVSVTNETIWNEKPFDEWENSKKTIWKEHYGISLFDFNWIDKCGSAKICNSSMVWRTQNAENWETPSSIPIDVTEHYRERILPHPILLIHTPLVNYAQTIQTFRKGNECKWGINQTMLLASVFFHLNETESIFLANNLWHIARNENKLLRTTLLNASLSHKKARVLFKKSTMSEKLRYFITFLRRPIEIINSITSIKNSKAEWNFLISQNIVYKK